MAFKRATKKQQKLRLALSGPSGSGKTYTALLLAKRLGERIALVDTERGSASKYAGDVADFDTQELDVFSVQNYLSAIYEAAGAHYDVLVIDSLSHAWAGRGGILDEVDRRGGKFDAWRAATPMQQKLVDAILSYPGHVIATLRSKMDYQVTITEKNGRKETKVEKLGLAPVQRDDLSYEFDVWLDMNERNVATVSKTRCASITGQAIDRPGMELADTLLAWLSDGAAPATQEPSAKPPANVQHLAEKAAETFPGATVETKKAEVDEYGLTKPTTPCPSFQKDGPNKGKRWDEVQPALIEKMLSEYGNGMSERQFDWATYLVARRQARKAREAREAAVEQARIAEANDTSSEGGGWVAGDEPGGAS